MKRNERDALARKSPAELNKDIQTHQERLWSLKVDLAAGRVKNVGEIKALKKSIARIKTLLHTKASQ